MFVLWKVSIVDWLYLIFLELWIICGLEVLLEVLKFILILVM